MVVCSSNSLEHEFMAKNEIGGIDPDSWHVTRLTLPKGYARGRVYGFCGGQAVGNAETIRAGSFGCWWPNDKPELLKLEGKKYVASGTASDSLIPGLWREASSEMRAACWFLRGGKLVARILHTNAFDQTWATATGGGVVVGMAYPLREPGRRVRNVGVVWRDGQDPFTVSADGDVVLSVTDGTRLAGSVYGRAMLWPSPNDSPIDLSPKAMTTSEVQALDGETQVGIAFKGFRARACLWRGTADSFVDLTPKKFQTARALGAARGYQVGFVREKDTTRDGSGGSDNRAVIWQGTPDRWFDLHALIDSSEYNASMASAIDVQGDVVRVCGQVSRYELYKPGTPHESHAVPVAHPVVWTARLINA
jgi:hypothetical protein